MYLLLYISTLSGSCPHNRLWQANCHLVLTLLFLLKLTRECTVVSTRLIVTVQGFCLNLFFDVSIQGLEALQKLAWKVMSVLYGSCLKRAGVYMNQLMKAKVYSL